MTDMNFEHNFKFDNESQAQFIWRMLNKGKRITSMWAFGYGITRLASRIYELKRLRPDAKIISERQPNGYNCYYLEDKI